MARKGMMVGDSEHNVQNDMLQVGRSAPDFNLIANDLSSKSLADYAGKVKVISVIPSIDHRRMLSPNSPFQQRSGQPGCYGGADG